MPDFSKRSDEKELLDQDDIPLKDLERNLFELDFINTHLGGHAVTISGLSTLMSDSSKTYTILDIGSGGGDTLRFVSRWASKRGLSVKLVGLDYKREAVVYASETSKDFKNISFVESDYAEIGNLDFTPDIIISSLFCHHLNDDQMINYVRLICQHAKIGIIINDLHRHSLAYYSIKWLTGIFSNSYLVKNDAAVSVSRGFSKKELLQYFLQAGLPDPVIKWKWAFRWLITKKIVD